MLQILASLALSAATVVYFGFVHYAIVAALAFVVVLSVFVSNERKIDASATNYELPPAHVKAIDGLTRLALACWCGACWPGLVIGAAFGWRRAAGGE